MMGNSHGHSKFPKSWFGKDIKKLQKLPNQFLPKFLAVFEYQTKQPSKLSILYFVFDLNCNVSNMQYLIHNV